MQRIPHEFQEDHINPAKVTGGFLRCQQKLGSQVFPCATNHSCSSKKSFEPKYPVGKKNILHTCQTKKKNTSAFLGLFCCMGLFLTPSIIFSPVFFFREEPWLSLVGDSLEPLQAIGFSPPSREAFVGGGFCGRNFWGLVKIIHKKKSVEKKMSDELFVE